MKKIISVFIVVSMVFIAGGNVAGAATQTWEPAGFGAGGLFPLIEVDPTETNIVYVGADVSGLYKSTDYGDTWTAVSEGLGSREISSFAVDPFNHLRLWLATPIGLYTSTNGSDSWSRARSDIHCFKHVNYRGISVSQDGQTILVASHDLDGETEGYGDGYFSGKLYRSSDGGTNWTVIQEFANTKIPSVMFDPYTTDQAFLLVDQQGIRRSTDGGKTWQDFSTGLPSALNWKNLDIGKNVIYATAAPTKIYKSTKDSASWQSIRSNISEDEDTAYPLPDAIRVSPSDDNTVYLGQSSWPSIIYKSTDGGQSWVGNTIPDDYQFDTTHAPHQNWINSYQDPVSIAIDPKNSSRLYNTTWWGVWRSDDGGDTWEEKVVGTQNTCCTDIDVSGTNLIATHMDVGILYSLDTGSTWLPGFPESEEPDFSLHAWSLEQGADGKIYAGVSTDKGPKVYRSDDNGVSWQSKSTGLIGTGNANIDIFSNIALAADPGNAGTIYAGVDYMQKNGLFRTTDYGDSWTLLIAPGSLSFGTEPLIKCLEVDPTDSNRIFAGLYWDGLWYSENGGQTWTLATGETANLASSSVQMIVALADGTVYAAFDDGVYKSSDKGKTFSLISSDITGMGESTLEYVRSIAINPADTNEIFAATARNYPIWYNQGSVWQTQNGGTNWVEITGDLPTINVVDLAYHNGYLYAATWCSNVYRTQISTDPITTTTATAGSSTTTTIEEELCPFETVYGESSEQTELLRYFRDNILRQTPEGREIIRLYYELSPAIVKAMEDDEFKDEVKTLIAGFLPLIGGGVE